MVKFPWDIATGEIRIFSPMTTVPVLSLMMTLARVSIKTSRDSTWVIKPIEPPKKSSGILTLIMDGSTAWAYSPPIFRLMV